MNIISVKKIRKITYKNSYSHFSGISFSNLLTFQYHIYDLSYTFSLIHSSQFKTFNEFFFQHYTQFLCFIIQFRRNCYILRRVLSLNSFCDWIRNCRSRLLSSWCIWCCCALRVSARWSISALCSCRFSSLLFCLLVILMRLFIILFDTFFLIFK